MVWIWTRSVCLFFNRTLKYFLNDFSLSALVSYIKGLHLFIILKIGNIDRVMGLICAYSLCSPRGQRLLHGNGLITYCYVFVGRNYRNSQIFFMLVINWEGYFIINGKEYCGFGSCAWFIYDDMDLYWF